MTGGDRRLRADAQRNREQLLAAAVTAFSGKALRTWMDLFIEHTTKRGMSDALRMVIASGGNPFAESRSRLTTGWQAAGPADGRPASWRGQAMSGRAEQCDGTDG